MDGCRLRKKFGSTFQRTLAFRTFALFYFTHIKLLKFTLVDARKKKRGSGNPTFHVLKGGGKFTKWGAIFTTGKSICNFVKRQQPSAAGAVLG